jgi:glycosyltransferase involved in cell wall biosynthesis
MDDVLIDITRLLNRFLKGRLPTGVDRVSLAYIQHYATRATALIRFAGRWVEFSMKDSQMVFAALLSHDERSRQAVRVCVARSFALRWHDMGGSRVLLNTGHSGLDHGSYTRRIRQINIARKRKQARLNTITPMRRRGLQPVFSLHDIIPITHPEYCRPGEAEKHHRRLETMVTIGRGLIFSSAATARALQNYAEKAGWKLPPCIVAPLAVPDLPPHKAERPLAGPYFVVLSTIEPRKNHLLLLHVWRQLVEDMGDAAPRLVVIGQRGWECEQVVDLLERSESLRGYVIEKSRCDDVELTTWLHHACALLFPSFTEGFGMPLVEALSLGVPVIASNLPVFREIAGDIPEFLDPLDGPRWKEAVLEYALDDSVRRRNQCERIKEYHAPTWERHFAQVDAFLNALIDKA